MVEVCCLCRPKSHDQSGFESFQKGPKYHSLKDIPARELYQRLQSILDYIQPEDSLHWRSPPYLTEGMATVEIEGCRDGQSKISVGQTGSMMKWSIPSSTSTMLQDLHFLKSNESPEAVEILTKATS